MAEIDVVKKGSKAWVWILLAIAVLLALWFLMAGNNPPRTAYTIEGGQPHAAALHSMATSRG